MAAVGKALKVAQLNSRGRATGFARMQQTPTGLYVVWTDAVNGKPRLQGALIR